MMNNAVTIGTQIAVSHGAGLSTAYGVVIGYDTTQWGTEHICIVDGQISYIYKVYGCDHQGIGARIATEFEIENYIQ
jgi:hypothetical protein